MTEQATEHKHDGDGASLLRGAAAGLVAGVLASFVMDRLQAALASPPQDGAADPATDKAADIATRALTGCGLTERDKPFGGQLVHYTLGTTLGLLYGIAAEYRPKVTIGYGAAFGAGVAAMLDDAAVPALGLANAPWKAGICTHFYALASHLVFGVVTEWTRAQVRSSFVDEARRAAKLADQRQRD